MSKVIKEITVWGSVYSNVTIETNDQGMFESGYIPGVGTIDQDSMVAEVINNTIKSEQ